MTKKKPKQKKRKQRKKEHKKQKNHQSLSPEIDYTLASPDLVELKWQAPGKESKAACANDKK